MVLAVIAILLVLHAFSFGEVLGQCGGHRSSASGTIESPKYPKPYPAGQDCIWTVAIEGSVENIKISFSSFDLQPKSADGECVDYVAIFRKQLNKDSEPVLEAKLCGGSIPQSLRLEESSMSVQFISDSVSGSYTGFSLHYETNFADSSVSQATAGIVAAVFCALVFIGVGMLRCIMLGACDSCGGPHPRDNRQHRQVVGTNESYTYRGDFPPSYSTVMHHPERYPTPQSSPQMGTQNRDGTANGDSHSPRQIPNGRTFSVGSSSSSDEDENDDPPPPYPGIVRSEAEVNVDVSNEDTNTTGDNEPNTAGNNDEATVTTSMTEEQTIDHGTPPEVEVNNEQRSSTAATPEALSGAHTAAEFSEQARDNRDDSESSQTGAPHEEIEVIV